MKMLPVVLVVFGFVLSAFIVVMMIQVERELDARGAEGPYRKETVGVCICR